MAGADAEVDGRRPARPALPAGWHAQYVREDLVQNGRAAGEQLQIKCCQVCADARSAVTFIDCSSLHLSRRAQCIIQPRTHPVHSDHGRSRPGCRQTDGAAADEAARAIFAVLGPLGEFFYMLVGVWVGGRVASLRHFRPPLGHHAIFNTPLFRPLNGIRAQQDQKTAFSPVLTVCGPQRVTCKKPPSATRTKFSGAREQAAMWGWMARCSLWRRR